MKKLALATAISTICVPTALASDVHYISTIMRSGTAQNPLAGFTDTMPAVPLTVKTWYVDAASGLTSNKTTAAIQLVRPTNWIFDFTDLSAVSFSGSIEVGDYRAQIAATGFITIDGRQSATGVVHTFSGVGVYDDASNTFSYDVLNDTYNGGGGSVYSAGGQMTCSNGQTSFLGKICQQFALATPAWEGLALHFVFAEDRNSFSGSLRGTNITGVNASRMLTDFNWYVAEVPIPAGAWLFGSGLLGLVGARRRRHQ